MKRFFWPLVVTILGLLWCAPVPYRLDIGRFDSGTLTHWYATEYGAGTSFRWSEPQAALHLPGVGAGVYDLVVSASSTEPRRTTIHAAGTTQSFSVGTSFAPLTMTLTMPPALDDALTIEFRTADTPSDGRRALGIAVDDVRLLPHGWHLPPLRAWAISVALVWLLAGVLRVTRTPFLLRGALAVAMVTGVIVLRRGDASTAVTQAAVVCGLVLALWHAQHWQRWQAMTGSLLVLVIALAALWIRGADAWMPLWQAALLVGSIAVLRTRRWWWHRLGPWRLVAAAVGFLWLGWSAWPVALGLTVAGGLAYAGAQQLPRSVFSAMAYAWWSIFERAGVWLRGFRGVELSATADRRGDRTQWDGLALFRGVVVLVVMLGHTPTLAVYTPAWIVTIVHWGVRMAVEGFFVLSGWLIGDLMVSQQHEWQLPRTLYLFLHRRWTRTLPLYWLVLLLVVLAGWSGATVADLGRYAVFVQNMAAPHPPFFLVAWSLSIEEWFYLVAALLLSITATRLPPKRALLLTLLALLVVPAALRSWYAVMTEASVTDVIRQLVPFRLDAIAAGVALVWAWRSWRVIHTHRTGILAVGVLLAGGYIGAVQLWAPQWEEVEWVRVSLIPVMTLTTLSLFPWLAGVERLAPGVFERWLTRVSVMSYPLYLLHYPVRQTLLGLSGTVGTALPTDIAVTVLYVLVSLWIARGWHIEVEWPFQRLRHRG